MATSAISGRLTVPAVNSFRSQPSSSDMEQTAEGAPIPVIYGFKSVVGRNAGYGVDAAGKLIVRVVWGQGEIYQVGTVWLNGESLPASVEANHYRGTPYQGIDPLMDQIVDLVDYADDMILRKPYGTAGIAYSVFRFPIGSISSAPRFQAIAAGRLVYDARKTAEYPDPFLSQVAFGVEFVGADDATPTDLDYGPLSSALTWSGTAKITSNQLALDGSGHVSIDGASIERKFVSDNWTVETRFTSSSIASGSAVILSKGGFSPDICFTLYRDGANIKLSLSSDGATADILNAYTVKSGISASTEYTITVEFTGREYLILDGTEIAHRVQSDDALFDTDSDWQVGAISGAARFSGSVATARFTREVFRYGGQMADGTTPNPWFESDTAEAGWVYSDVSALCALEFATNKFYGLGAERSTAANDLIPVEWNETILDSDFRCRISMVIDEVKPAESWFDLLCTYAECFWIRGDSGDIKLIPDRAVTAENPSGWIMGENPEFATDPSTNWDYGSDWIYVGAWGSMYKGAATAPGDIDDLVLEQEQTKVFETGATYIATVEIFPTGGGTVRLELDGVEILEDQSVAGIYAVEFEAAAGSDLRTLEVVVSLDFIGLIGKASIHRKYWKEDKILANSLSITGQTDSGTPTAIVLHYTQPSLDTPAWPSLVYDDAQLPGVAEGLIPSIDTQIYMDGVLRFAEAANKAQTKLARMSGRYKIQWVSTDIGVALQQGTVVQVVDASAGINELVLVESAQMVSPGRYRVTGSNYSPSHYPSEVVSAEGYGTVPVGAILPMAGSTVPAGWSAWALADGKFIRGTTTSVGTTGGATSVTPPTLTVTAGTSDHDGMGKSAFLVDGVANLGGFLSKTYYSETVSNKSGGHSDHTVTPDAFDPDVYRAEKKWIIKTGTASSTIPFEAIVFGLPDIAQEFVSRYVVDVGRVLAAATAPALAGSSGVDVLFKTTTSSTWSHNHWTAAAVTNGNYNPSTGFGTTWNAPENAGAAHTHIAVVLAEKVLAQIKIPAYRSAFPYKISPGFIFGWAGSLVSLPTDYSLCDGTDGTPDMSGVFLCFSGLGDELEITAGDKIVYTGQTNNAGSHNHVGAEQTGSERFLQQLRHKVNHEHFHGIVETEQAWTPPYYALAFIMYNPA